MLEHHRTTATLCKELLTAGDKVATAAVVGRSRSRRVIVRVPIKGHNEVARRGARRGKACQSGSRDGGSSELHSSQFTLTDHKRLQTHGDGNLFIIGSFKSEQLCSEHRVIQIS